MFGWLLALSVACGEVDSVWVEDLKEVHHEYVVKVWDPVEYGRLARRNVKYWTQAAESGTKRVIVISDLNGRYGSKKYQDSVHRAIDAIVEIKPDLVIATGDLVAGQKGGLDYDGMWEAFHETVTVRLENAGIPFAPSPGNHDASIGQKYWKEREIFEREWSLHAPTALNMLNKRFYPLRYSYALGSDILFISLDDTNVGPLADEQMKWLRKQLRRHDYPVKILYGHVPLYPFVQEIKNQYIGDPELEDYLAEYEVDAFITGHHHAWYPGVRSQQDGEKDLKLISAACLGDGRRTLMGEDRKSSKSIILMEIDGDGIQSVRFFGGEFYNEELDPKRLPRSVGSGSQKIYRDDNISGEAG